MLIYYRYQRFKLCENRFQTLSPLRTDIMNILSSIIWVIYVQWAKYVLKLQHESGGGTAESLAHLPSVNLARLHKMAPVIVVRALSKLLLPRPKHLLPASTLRSANNYCHVPIWGKRSVFFLVFCRASVSTATLHNEMAAESLDQ